MQNSKYTRVDRFAVALAEKILLYPKITIFITLLIGALLASGVIRLQVSNNYRVFFSEKNPDLIAFEQFEGTYAKNDNFLFVLKPAGGKVFDQRIIDAVEQLTKKAWSIPFATRVDSVTNFQYSWADGDDLTVEDLIRNGASLSSEELDSRRDIALAEPLLRGQLISLDADTTGVNVILQYPEKTLTEVPTATAAARQLAAEIEQEYPGVEVVVSGISALNNAFAESTVRDGITLFPAMFVVLVIATWLIVRSVSVTLTKIVVITMSTAVAMGYAGFAGIPISPFSGSAPVIILTLAIADSIHVMSSMITLMREGKDKLTALKESIRINFLPVTITSVSTIVGFLALNFSDAPPFHHLGNMASVGIAAAWFYSLTFLPAAISICPCRIRIASGQPRGLQQFVERVVAFVTAHYKIMSICCLVFTVGLALVIPTIDLNDQWVKYVGLALVIPTIDLNDQWVKYFDERFEFRQDAEFAINNLTGLYPVEFSVRSGEAGAISNPSYLEKLEELTEWLRKQPEVVHVYSYADIIKRLNKNMHEDDPAWYRIPDSRELAAQYLLLYELSLPYGLDLNDRINIDKSATRVTATLDDIPTRQTRAFITRAKEWFSANTPEHMRSGPTGAPVMFSYISERNIHDMLRGNVIAVILIAIIMMIALRSVAFGAFSLVPNIMPILMTFGIWAILVGQIGMAAATVSATSLGIIVDDTVHFLTKYLRARREQGLDRAGAINYAFRTVGFAIFATSIILAAGFGVLAFSTFKITGEMGTLTALAIIIALVGDFLFLPSLLLLGSKKTSSKGVKP
jgi:predicted RND superfamily exporter protein